MVKSIEYDPNRSARIALLYYVDGVPRLTSSLPNGLQVGQTVVSGPEAAPEVGNALPLSKIPVGTVIHNSEGSVLAKAHSWHARPVHSLIGVTRR